MLRTLVGELAGPGERVELLSHAVVIELLGYDADGCEFTQAYRFGSDGATVDGTRRLLRRGLELTEVAR